jgi:hypothetical protein
MLGKRLGKSVLQTAEAIKCEIWAGRLSLQKCKIRCPGQAIAVDTQSIRPTKHYTFTSADEREEQVEILKLGDMVLVGVRPELCCQTAADIKEQSPFAETMIMTMVNGAAKYMPECGAYDRITYEAMNSPFARGAAELLSKVVMEQLRS